jgi:hypothetical protein
MGLVCLQITQTLIQSVWLRLPLCEFPNKLRDYTRKRAKNEKHKAF